MLPVIISCSPAEFTGIPAYTGKIFLCRLRLFIVKNQTAPVEMRAKTRPGQSEAQLQILITIADIFIKKTDSNSRRRTEMLVPQKNAKDRCK